ncbi:sensor histidine kinase [Neptunicoccus sediminis]|uniref:sensor histidine kinase n=1 Tax=Neptunicoccus sediminis TaxID=1892596 RepID=UPI0008461BEA|nr:HAMP domain-containing sensor histidine kinase [Neptunicoccus sediminis]
MTHQANILISTDPASLKDIQTRLADYVGRISGLLVQRQTIFMATAILAAVYFDFWIAVYCMTLIQITEVIDIFLARRVQADARSGALNRVIPHYYGLLVNTVLNASAICFFIFIIARQEGSTTHFTPMFFLFAAALFAAMNNHQVLAFIGVRLAIYTITFLAIPVIDIIQTDAEMMSPIWLQMFTVIFVLFFIVDSSVVYIKLYRRNLEQMETLKEEKEKATSALIAKSRFLSTISHELRTPLTSVSGAIALLDSGAMGELSDHQKRTLAIARKNAANLTEMVGDVLDVQSLEADELLLNMDTVDCPTLLKTTFDTHVAAVESQGRKLQIQDALPAVSIRADKKRLHRILSGLISNAVKFSAPGTTITLGLIDRDGQVELTVADEGEGIPEGQEDAVFSSFTQLDGTDVRKAGGNGLGLFLARAILKEMDGSIRYDSVLGSGTTFTVAFDKIHSIQKTPATADV